MCEKIIFHGGTHGFFGEIYWITVRKISCAHEDRRMGSNWKFFERWIINWPCLKKNSIGTGEVLITTTTWWRHHVETFSALLAICAGNSPVTGEFPAQRPVTRSFDVFCDLRLNKRLSKQSRGWWFDTPSCPLWRHCNEPTPRPTNDGHSSRFVLWPQVVVWFRSVPPACFSIRPVTNPTMHRTNVPQCTIL